MGVQSLSQSQLSSRPMSRDSDAGVRALLAHTPGLGLGEDIDPRAAGSGSVDVGRFWMVAQLRPGTRHEYRVRAKNMVGWGEWGTSSRICRTDRTLATCVLCVHPPFLSTSGCALTPLHWLSFLCYVVVLLVWLLFLSPPPSLVPLCVCVCVGVCGMPSADIPFAPARPECMAISNGVVIIRFLPPRSNGSRVRRYQVHRRRIRRYDDPDDMSDPGDGNDLAYVSSTHTTRTHTDTLARACVCVSWTCLFFSFPGLTRLQCRCSLAPCHARYNEDSATSSDDEPAETTERWRRACDDVVVGANPTTSARVMRLAQDAFGPGSMLTMANVSGFCSTVAPPARTPSTATTATATMTMAQQGNVTTSGGGAARSEVGGRSMELVLTLCEGLLPLTTHEFKVRAQNEVGWSDWSACSDPVTTRGGCWTALRDTALFVVCVCVCVLLPLVNANVVPRCSRVCGGRVGWLVGVGWLVLVGWCWLVGGWLVGLGRVGWMCGAAPSPRPCVCMYVCMCVWVAFTQSLCRLRLASRMFVVAPTRSSQWNGKYHATTGTALTDTRCRWRVRSPASGLRCRTTSLTTPTWPRTLFR